MVDFDGRHVLMASRDGTPEHQWCTNRQRILMIQIEYVLMTNTRNIKTVIQPHQWKRAYKDYKYPPMVSFLSLTRASTCTHGVVVERERKDIKEKARVTEFISYYLFFVPSSTRLAHGIYLNIEVMFPARRRVEEAGWKKQGGRRRVEDKNGETRG